MLTQQTGSMGKAPGDSAVAAGDHTCGWRLTAGGLQNPISTHTTPDVAPPGSYLELKGRFGSAEFDSHGRLRGLVLVRGTELRCGSLHLRADREVSLSMTCTGPEWTPGLLFADGLRDPGGAAGLRAGEQRHSVDRNPRRHVADRRGDSDAANQASRSNGTWPDSRGRSLVSSTPGGRDDDRAPSESGI